MACEHVMIGPGPVQMYQFGRPVWLRILNGLHSLGLLIGSGGGGGDGFNEWVQKAEYSSLLFNNTADQPPAIFSCLCTVSGREQKQHNHYQ